MKVRAFFILWGIFYSLLSQFSQIKNSSKTTKHAFFEDFLLHSFLWTYAIFEHYPEYHSGHGRIMTAWVAAQRIPENRTYWSLLLYPRFLVFTQHRQYKLSSSVSPSTHKIDHRCHFSNWWGPNPKRGSTSWHRMPKRGPDIMVIVITVIVFDTFDYFWT